MIEKPLDRIFVKDARTPQHLDPVVFAICDHIFAVIRATSVNQDGNRSNGLAAPSPSAQIELLKTAWRRAGIESDTLGFIETHGTGTRLGDAIEFKALSESLRGRSSVQPRE